MKNQKQTIYFKQPNCEKRYLINRLAVGGHKVDNRIDQLMALHKTDIDTQTTAVSGDQLQSSILVKTDRSQTQMDGR